MYDSKQRTTDSLFESRKDGSGHSSSKRESNNDETSNNRKYFRTQSTSNNRTVPSNSSSQQQRQNGDKDKKSVKDTKKPLRVSGDWSEFRSSTGKTYFYNSKTEVSQWEQPKGWPSDASTNHRPAAKKLDSTPSNNGQSSSTIRSRHKVEESNSNPLKDLSVSSKNSSSEQINGHEESQHQQQHSDSMSISTSSHRLPSPDDDSSRMSFSSTSSKESTAINNVQRRNSNGNHSVHEQRALTENAPATCQNGIGQKSSSVRPTSESSPSVDGDSTTATISKAEREQEIQKYYRADLIQHLTDWSSTQLEKQCLKLFDDYYGYSAKMSTTQTELKSLKSNIRVLEIKRTILTQRLVRCQQHMRERENDSFS